MPRRDPFSGTTPITVLVPNDVAAEIAVVARAEGVNVSEVIRAGMYRHLSSLRTDPAFQKRLRKRLDEDREVMERYAG
jgi:Arc/MetJ-type ribon-helix-helix transcriptional regulator